ncbi:MAG: hypothetical protein J6D09_06945 [Clostridia bacterium]|nr:hypothetical protein [Clostridia bacterium]
MKNHIFSGYMGHGSCHCQGIAVDKKNGYLYYSFTTKLLKSDLDGNIIGSVDKIVGHLGCIDFNERDGKVYASLEYKNDEIGRGILKTLGVDDDSLQDAFYVAIFDVDKIDRMDMNAETDGIMKTVYLGAVVDDYNGTAKNGAPHIHGCSGIDGITVGPDFGDKNGKHYLHVCEGIYSDHSRTDNDYQVVYQYDVEGWWDSYAQPLNQHSMHRSGPEKPRNQYFFYTGNTTYGVQNFEYDEFTGDYFACVYEGSKPQFPNYPMFVVDGSIAPKEEELIGCDGEKGLVLTLKNVGLCENGICGASFPHGCTGFYSFGDGRFFVSQHTYSADDGQATNVYLYRLVNNNGVIDFEKID